MKRPSWTLKRHHVIPRSRGGTSNPDNIVMVPEKHHILYHQLFANKTPEEIIEYLVHEFWQDQWWWLNIAKERYIGNQD